MPVMDGIEATRGIAETGDDVLRILILTTFDLDDYVYDALQAGASGFLLEDVPAETLFDAVRVVAAGDALLAPAITRRLIDEFARMRPRQVVLALLGARRPRRYASPHMLVSVTALYRLLLQSASLSWSMNLVISSIRFAKAPPSFIAAAIVSCEP